MSNSDLVPFPSTLLRDDSSYYGDDETKAQYDEDLRAFNPRHFWDVYEKNYECLRIQAQAQGSARPIRGIKRKRETVSDEASSGKMNQTKINTEGSSVQPKAESSASTATASPSPEPTASAQFENPYEGMTSAKQTDESISDFLKRIPPSRTTSMDINDSWIWVANPRFNDRSSQKVGNFKEAGFALLESLAQKRAELEAENPTKQPGSITRMMKPYRENTEARIVHLAKSTSVLTGKWMLFPNSENVDEVWRNVAEATWDGTLGNISAKVAPRDDSDTKPERLICIYVQDFTDVEDVKNVLDNMRQLRLVQDGSSAKVIYFKADAYTHLDLLSGNDFKIKASMYNSRDMFKEMAKEKTSKRK